MFERFTDRARKVMQLANQEAQRFNHEYIGTEHILLGLVKEGSGVAANVLKNLDIDLRKIRLEVEKLIRRGPDMVTMGKLPQTPRAKKVIELAIESARERNGNYIGTEHILFGLIAEEQGVAAQVLSMLGVTQEKVSLGIEQIIGKAPKAIYGLPATGVETSRVENRSEPAGCFKAELTVTKELPGQQAVTVRNSIAIIRADEPGAVKKAVEWVGIMEEKIKVYDHCTISYVLQSLAANPSLNSHVAAAYRAVAAEICNHAASLTSEMQAVIGTGDERERCAAHLDSMAHRAESPAIKAAYVLAAKQLRELK